MEGNKKWVVLFLVFAIGTIGAIGGYVYYTRTPAYSLKLIEESVKEHNWQKFNRHVDVKSISESAFDDLIAASAEEDKNTDENIKNMATGFIQMFKPMFVNALQDSIKKFVEEGTLNQDKKDTQAKNNSKEEQGNQAANNWIKNSRASESKFTGIKNTNTEGSIATVTLGLRDEKLKADYEIKLLMNQLEDGTWRLTKISNIKEFYKSVEAAKKKELDRLNKPIRSEIDNAIQLGEMTVSVEQSDSFGFLHKLLITGDVKINSEKSLDSFSGDITITSPEDKIKTMRYNYEFTEGGVGNQKIVMSKELNPFISVEKDIIKQKAQGYKFEISVTELKYMDGTTTKILEELPE